MTSLRDESARLADEEAYTSLLEICTELIIAEGTDDPPLKQPLGMLHELLHRQHLGGDATVLSVRAVRILLEKFISAMSSKLRVKLVECARSAFERVSRLIHGSPTSDADSGFVHTKRWELQEELLQCMSAAAQSDSAVQAALPPLQEQLTFCKSVMDVSLDMCLQALRMCCVLLRSAQLSAQPHLVSMIRDLFQSRLTALESMEMNQDWLRLLRHLTEVAVTLKAYAARTPETAEANAITGKRMNRKRKRTMASNPSRAARISAAGVDGERGDGTDEALVLLRLCQKVCATPRLDRAFRSTVFSCVNAVLSDAARIAGVSADTCVSVAMDLARELTRNVRTTLTIANPFVNREGAKWHLPEPEWPLLVLIANIFAAKTVPTPEHMWWSVGDDEYARRFSKEDRLRLTNAFFAAEDVLDLKKRGSRVHLSTMREFLWPFDLGCRVLFQPVPCTYAVAEAVPVAPSLQCPPSRAGELTFALRKCDVSAFLEHLGAVLHNGGDVAAFGQSVLLQVLLVVGPHARDVTRAALLSFLADAATPLIEQVSEVLVRHDRAWASTLLDAGVTETILRRSTSVTPERSPVVQMLRREAASLPSTPPLLPRCGLPTVGPAELRRVLQHGGRSDVEALLEVLTFTEACVWDTVACREAVRALAGAATLGKDSTAQANGAASAGWARQLEHLLTSLVMKRLQDMALQLQQRRTLQQIVEESEVVEVIVCDNGRSSQFTCPRQHPLHHHHSCNWKCDECSASGLQDAWSCRECDYDLCATCARTRCNRVNGALTATTQDLLTAWRASADTSTEVSAPLTRAVLFSEERGLVSVATPLACLHRQSVHLGEIYTACPCGLVSPGPAKPLEAAAATDTFLLGTLLSLFGRTCGQDVGVQRRLLKAYESAGPFVFLGGARAVPAELRCLTTHLAPHLPLSVKNLITRYVAIDCRRFAFQTLHDQAATVMSANTGVAPESPKPHKTQVPRSDKPALLRVLHDSFCGLLSPLVKVDFTFEGEEGFGSGPSQEVYTELSAYFRAESKFWFVTEDDGGADPVTLPFPTTKALFLKEFFALGAACARAFIDEYRMDMDLLPQAWPLLMLPSLGLPVGQKAGARSSPCASTLAALTNLLEVLDPSLHRSFAQLRRISEAELAAVGLEMDDGTLLRTHADLEQHLQLTVVTRFEVALENLRHFQWGLLSVMEVEALWCLSDEERSMLICGSDAKADGPLFTEEELRAQTTMGSGYSSGSVHVEMLLSIVGGDFTRAQQRDFLEFLTGSPRLPFNGLAGLGRLITVAMKDMESKDEQTLPSCNTCFLYLKLPPYTTREIMRERLLLAVTEGRRNYSLS
ncbi:HECT-domain (ubiquitin-transferase) family protein [Leishmania donovani]|uniref:HECT-domain (Ubiquitin-transferase) family protein n=1 Tax=Leishmania donovani TaxID=5661 RepID=A0A504XEH0_LEIDO|nr:HECT-domain (ubiquitin-transferase) family protein [Leishmania donovani]